MNSALQPISSTVRTTELKSFARVWPVMSITGPQMPVPALTISANAITTSAVAPAVNESPKTARIASGYRTDTRKNGIVSVSAQRVAVT
ncbi:MAG: hypothetical protein KatS3mg010_2099 [Acidimicrobiia bacterium]|nr:MAG: hypothetical protein KatS3mg010_2099 [Acidimicrobiia bacterium]